MLNRFKLPAVALLLLILLGCGNQQPDSADSSANGAISANAERSVDKGPDGPPMAEQRPKVLTMHDHERIDEFFWLRSDQRDDEEVLAYLHAENAWTDSVMAGQQERVDALFAEMRGRIKEDDSSVPVKRGDYWYYSRFEEGQQYAIHARRKGSMEAEEEILIDGNQRAEGHGFYQLANTQVSPDGRWLAFAEDYVGRRQYQIGLRDLESGEWLETGIDGATPAIAWSADSEQVFYVGRDPVTLLPYQVWRHQRGTQGEDVLVWEETDSQYYTTVYNTRSGDYVAIHMSATLSDEIRLVDAHQPEQAPEPLIARRDEHQYSIDHIGGDGFYVRSNLDAPNFRLVRLTRETAEDPDQWQEILAHREEAFVSQVSAFERFIAVGERSDGLRRIRILAREDDGGEQFLLDFDEPAFTAALSINPDPASDRLRYSYTSMTTPASVNEYHFDSGEHELLDQEEVLGDFDSANYRTLWLEVPARDGESIPVSLVHHVDTPLDGTAPLYQYAYGSYGNSSDPRFSSARLSLLDRGMVFAIAHIRGGQERGRRWYDDGRMLNKWNTYYDFIDVTRHLGESGMIDPERVVAMGGSAGGLLMGAVVNTEPALYHAVVAHVPFVDVVSTMLDESIPLTTGEYNEWGNPNDPEYYHYMLSYSPYDNVSEQAYPHMLVTTGLHDSQVQYWEPAKWVARLRARKTDDNQLLLRTNMEAGHGGASGRFSRLEEVAFEYAWVLERVGL